MRAVAGLAALVAAMAIVVPVSAASRPQAADVQEAVLALYEAVAERDTAAAARLVHLDARYFASRNDKLIQMPLRLWIGQARERGPVRIRSLEVAGTAAAVAVERGAGDDAVTEHLSLVHYNGRWGAVALIQGSGSRREATPPPAPR